MFDPYWHDYSSFWCLWLIIHVAITVWNVLWLHKKVRMVEKAVEWRKLVAGKWCRFCVARSGSSESGRRELSDSYESNRGEASDSSGSDYNEI